MKLCLKKRSPMLHWGGGARARGFALVVTLSLMVLLSLLLVGLLNLSAISLAVASDQQAVSRARANARLALTLALGDLQKQAGPDTRVTARADLLDENAAPVLGVWRSWEGENHNEKGRPVSPGNYRAAKDEHFLAWLVSDPRGDGSKTPPPTAAGAGTAALVGAGSVGTGPGREKQEIHLNPVNLSLSAGESGGLAWWVAGENLKAGLPRPYRPDEDEASQWAVLAKSHAVADPAVFQMERLRSEPESAAKVISLTQSDFVADQTRTVIDRGFFHDLSTDSVGLLTNTATGGWRKDLSLLTENWDSQPRNRLPFFRVAPDEDLMFTRPSASDATSATSMIYPWSAYRGSSSDIPIYRHGPVSSWENLKDYATTYKRVTSGGGRSKINTQAVSIDDTGNSFNFLHKVRILPIVARIQWVFSHSAQAISGTEFEPRLILTPVLTMWNPYNVEITGQGLDFNIPRPLPPALRYMVGTARSNAFQSILAGSTNNLPPLSTAGSLDYQIRSSFTLKPGETRVFSPRGVAVAAGSLVELAPGYRDGGGHFFPIPDAGGRPLRAPGSALMRVDARFDTSYLDVNQGVGIYLDMSAQGRRLLVYRMIYTPMMANQLYPPLPRLAEVSVQSAASSPAPFLSTIFGARMASRTHTPAKGFVQSSPLVNYTAMGTKDLAESTIQRHYGGTSHPVNSPFDYSFIKHSPSGDSQLPNASDTSGRGYIVTGFNKSDGLSRCVIAELPTRPLLSLGELQGWDLRYENPIPPFAFNLIGNSDASPLLPPDAVVNRADENLAQNLQHDDSYCANHLLFDDWFLSSIAPDPRSFGAAGGNIKTTYTDFLEGTKPLGNRAYQAIAADRAAAAAGRASALYQEQIARPDGWRNVASRLEVEGMFNVNSTSRTAWRALLGHARDQRIPYISESATGWSVELSDEEDFAFSRFTVSGEGSTSSSGTSGEFPEASEFSGFRVFDEAMLDELADEVVAQVRARGPFLSLSEFVNRQLSQGDLALAGAVQSALNKLAAKGGSSPFETIQALSTDAVASPVRAPEAEYKFPEAAIGKSAYGLPGWTRQADVLRPLAPILSARDDTFKIRAHGDARDSKGNILSSAVCEAVVRRTRDYVDPSEDAGLTTPPEAPLNIRFGRRFEIVSFRWLRPSGI